MVPKVQCPTQQQQGQPLGTCQGGGIQAPPRTSRLRASGAHPVLTRCPGDSENLCSKGHQLYSQARGWARQPGQVYGKGSHASQTRGGNTAALEWSDGDTGGRKQHMLCRQIS